jgi:type IV pili sensor histidine kinase/response regulator
MKKIKNKMIIAVTVICIVITPLAWASKKNLTPIGRYLTIENKPQTFQVDLLSQIIQVRFPQNIQTVGEAMNYLLRLSGYSLIPANHRSEPLKIMLNKPLPIIDRDFGPMSLKDALITLAGPAFYLTEDPVNRSVDFRLRSSYARFYAKHRKASHSTSKEKL